MPHNLPKTARNTWLLLGAVTLLGLLSYRLWLLGQPWVGLYHDESYYYHWSLIPDFGYYSKPPMVAWVIGLSSSLWGATSAGIKLGPALCWFATAIALGRIAAKIWNVRLGVLTAIIFYSTPLAGFYSLFATTDAPFLLFWALALLGFINAQQAVNAERDPLFWWLAAGLATGLGLLSKYTMFVLPFSFLVFLVTSPARRAQLQTLGPWLAGSVALALFSLNALWNIDNEFVAWQHTSDIAKLDGQSLHPSALIEFWGAQLGIFGLIGSILIARWWRIWWAEARAKPELFACLLGGAMLLIGISIQAFMSRAFANWAAPVTLTLTLMLAAIAAKHLRWVLLAIASNIILLAVFYQWPVILALTDSHQDKRINPWFRVQDWATPIAQSSVLSPFDKSLPVASDSRAVLANMSFALHPRQFPGAYWDADSGNIRDYYDQTINFDLLPDAQQQRPYLFALEAPISEAQRASFRHIEPVAVIDNYFQWHPGKSLYLYRVGGFSGY